MTVHIRPMWRRVRSTLSGDQGSDRGSATVELVAGAPLLIVCVMFAVLCGRVAIARIDVNAAAAAGARAASQQRSPSAARTQATAAATAALGGHGVTCTRLTVVVDTSRMRPGGSVSVDVTCTLSTSDLLGLSLPGTVRSTGHSTSPVDTYRALGGGQ